MNDRDQQNTRLAIATAQMLQQNNGNDNRKKPDIMDAFEHLNGHGWSEYRALKPAEDQCDAGKTEKDSPTPIDAVADKREVQRDPEIWVEYAEHFRGNLPGHGDILKPEDDADRQLQ